MKHIAILRFSFQIVFVCLYITPSHYHHCANNIWRQWTYKMPVRCNLSSVWVRSSIFSVIHYTICRAVCFQFTHFLCDDWENIYTLSYYHYQIGSMNYYPLFMVRSWNNCMRCMTFYIIIPAVRSLYVSYGLLTANVLWIWANPLCKKGVTPLLTHWSNVFRALNHRYTIYMNATFARQLSSKQQFTYPINITYPSNCFRDMNFWWIDCQISAISGSASRQQTDLIQKYTSMPMRCCV